MSAEKELYSGCQWLARWGHAPWITWPFLAGCLAVSVSTWFSSRCYPFLLCLCRIHLAAKKERIVQGNFYDLHALTGDTYEARVAPPLPSLSSWLTLPLLSCLATSSVQRTMNNILDPSWYEHSDWPVKQAVFHCMDCEVKGFVLSIGDRIT